MTPPRPSVDDRSRAGLLRDAMQRHGGLWLNAGIALACAGVIAGIWLTSLQRIAFERRQAIDAAMHSNANLAIAFEQQVFRTLKAAEQVAAFVREQYRWQGGRIPLRQWVEQRVLREDLFTIISVVDETGAIVASSQDTGVVSYADRAFFQVHRGRGRDAAEYDMLYISKPVLGRVSNRWQIPMSLPMMRPDGGFGGVVVLSIDLENFSDFYRQTDLGRHGMLELTRLDGTVLGRKIGNQNLFGMDASGLAWFQRRSTQQVDNFVDEGNAADGVARIVSFRTLNGYPLMITVGTAYEDDMAPVRQRQSRYLAAASTLSLLLLVLAVLLMRSLSRQRAVTHALKASEALFRATFHQAAMGIAHIAPDGRILGANQKFCQMLGYDETSLQERTVYDLSEPAERDNVRQLLAQCLSASATDESPEIEKPYRRRDGSVLWVCEALGVVRDEQGQPDFLVAVVQDITSRKALEDRLSHAAMHDALTGLPNRLMFHDRCDRVLESAHRHGRLAAVLYLDLDGFKAVNDSLGHAAGDLLLQQAARRLEACVRHEDTVSRFGGDEFGIVLTEITQAADCGIVAQKIIDAMSTPFDLGVGRAQISASVGAAVFPDHGGDTDALVALADTAMYTAKRQGKNQFAMVAKTGKAF